MSSAPGWVDKRLSEVVASLQGVPGVDAGLRAYADCLAAMKAPAAPSDLLGAEFTPCRRALHQALRAAGVDQGAAAAIETDLEALEAEIAAAS